MWATGGMSKMTIGIILCVSIRYSFKSLTYSIVRRMESDNFMYGLHFPPNIQENDHFGPISLFLTDLKATFLVWMTEITKGPRGLIEFNISQCLFES